MKEQPPGSEEAVGAAIALAPGPRLPELAHRRRLGPQQGPEAA